MIYTTFDKKGKPSFEFIGDEDIVTETRQAVDHAIEKSDIALPLLGAFALRHSRRVRYGAAALHKVILAAGHRELIPHGADYPDALLQTVNSDGLACVVRRSTQAPIHTSIVKNAPPAYIMQQAANVGADMIADQYPIVHDDAGRPELVSRDVHVSVGAVEDGMYRAMATVLHPDYLKELVQAQQPRA